MPDATITSTASTFGTITGTFAADQSTIVGTVTGIVAGTLDGSVGVPGPVGPTGPQGPEGPPGPPGEGGTWGSIVGTLSAQLDLQAALDLKAPLASPVFTGDARAVTPAFGDNDTSISTTAFVQAALAGGTAVAKNLEVYVRNQSGSTIPAGSIVYISGATGNRPLITLAQANNDANSAQTIGFVKESIANNGFGYVMVRGELENIDTSALTEGVQLYLSPTTAGTWTTTKPSAPQHLVYVGIVIRSHPTQGVILVAVQNGYEVSELHDSAINGVANNDLFAYESSTNLWKNKTYSALGLLTSADAASTYYLASNPAGYQTAGQVSTALTPYLLSSTAASTYQTQAAMSAYLTTSAAAAGYYPLTGNPSGFLTAASLSGYATQAWVDAQGYLQAGALTGYALESWVTSQGYLTSGSLVGYATESYVTSALTGYATESWVIGLGYITSVDANAAFYPLTGNPSGFVDSSALSGYATESWVTSQGYLTSAPVLSVAGKTGSVTLDNTDISGLGTMATASTADYSTTTVANGLYYPLSSNPSGYLVAADIAGKANSASPALTGNVTITTNSTSPALVITQDGTGDIIQFKDVTSDTTYSFIDQNGKVGTIASATTNAGFNIPHGTAPTSPVNGDIWTTTSGLFMRQNGSTKQYVDFDGTQTINGAKTFSNANQTLGNSTAAGTIAIGTGATVSGSTRTINIGTASAAGSTNAINIGGGSGTSTTTLNGTVNATTAAADTNSVQVATTAFVIGQAGSATPLVNGTAAVGTSLRYARQDHVHGTDTTRAALAGATFTGLVSTPASATGSAGFRIVPGVAPTTPTNGDMWATTNDLQVRLNGTTETIAEQSWVTSQLGSYLTTATAASTYQTQAGMSSYLTTASAALTYAPLASPTFTGTVTIPAGASISGYATTASLSSYAPLASPALTGTPTAPTAAVDTNTTQVATTAYVVGQGYLKSATASSTYAPLASPALTGTPTAPTATAGTSTTQLATTAFVTTADNLKANLASPAFTGTPTAPTATAGTNTTQIATTAFVAAAIPTNSVKAWVNFNGTGTVAIRASLNVSSITDNGTGDYTVNLTSALTDVNFASVIGTTDDNAAASYGYERGTAGQFRTTTAFRFYIFGGALRDNTGVYVALFR